MKMVLFLCNWLLLVFDFFVCELMCFNRWVSPVGCWRVKVGGANT